MSETYAIELKNITKRFGKVTANDKVCLSVKKGEILSILGENGSGKTTLMNMISGIYYPDEGQILVNGKEVTIRSPKDSFALGIGMIHQHFKLVDVLTAAENIILGLPGKEVLDMKSVAAKINELTSRYGFDLDPNQKIYTMSVSQKQTVEIVKLLYRGVDILILDEPTAVLTNVEAQNLFNSMHRLKEQGTAMVFITHHLDEVMEETDRITIMKDGQLVEEILTSEITKEEMITKMAGKKVNVAKHVKRTYSNEKFFEAKNLTRTGEFENVSFDVKKGEILCVAGLVGAGRTEIFKCVFGITEKEPGGHTFIEGKEVNIKSPIEAIKCGMGYVSEERRHD